VGSVELLENGMASHLRICLSITLDQTWRFTSYLSEPLLSCVAAINLHGTAQSLEKSLEELLDLIKAGMIDMGQRDELASRLLWLLAKDLFIRTRHGVVTTFPSTWDEHLIDCQMIPVVDWLEFIFGSRIWDRDNTQASLARKMFENAYLNFSHWVRMDTHDTPDEEEELPLDAWTLPHWQRTSAVQCCYQQTRVDKVIPIYFKDEPSSLSAKERMSQIFISDEARRLKDPKRALLDVTGGEDIVSNSTSLPYIAILADLSQPTSFSVTFPEQDVDDRCLRIYAAGVDTTTYPFLASCPALMGTLQDLVHRRKIRKTEMFYANYLDAQVRFGSTSTAEHMEWEHGSTVPEKRSS